MNENLPSFEEFLASQSIQIPVSDFIINLLFTALLAFLLGQFYRRYGKSLSNRGQFAGNFILIAMTTMLIISIVKASLALSLGLVGALSIVRFRSAIKEPEELAYLFLLIAIGLGFGADQRITTLVAFSLILGILWLQDRAGKRQEPDNLYLTVGTNGHGKVELQAIVNALEKHCTLLELKRLDEDQHQLEAAFVIRFKNLSDLEAGKTSLYSLDHSLRIGLIDQRSLGGIN
jgi:uncharacterized membrane protein YhiD involved in acid resistance